MTPQRVTERALRNVEPDGECIVSRYSVGSHGYCQVGWHEGGRSVMRLVHRVAWEAFHGPIPSDRTIDHLCRNRRCLNVDHLRIMPNDINARMNSQWARTECHRGHPFDEVNTYWNGRGHRICRECQRDRRAA